MNYNVVIGVGEKESPALFPDISEAETFAVGQMTVAWGTLEHLLIGVIACLASRQSVDVPENLHSQPFKNRLAFFNERVEKMPEGKVKKKLKTISSRIANVQTERHGFTHGIWAWDLGSPGKIRNLNVRKRSKVIKNYDFDEISAVAKRIGQINFDLMHPRGLQQFYAEKAKEGFSMSRKFSLAITGKASSDPTLQLFKDTEEQK